MGKDINVEMLLSVSYDNKERYSASKLVQQFDSSPTKKPKKISTG